MFKRLKLFVAVVAGTIAVSIPVVLTAGAAQEFTPDNLPLTVLSETNRSITFGWTPVPGYGYLFKTQASPGADWVIVSRTNDPTRDSIRFSKGSYDYAVGALGEVAVGKASDITPPPPPTDTQAPSDPTGLAASNRTTISFALSWTASTDNVAVTGYDVYQGTNVVQTQTGTTYQFTGLTCGTNYNVGVVAFDAADNHSAKASLNVSTLACASTASITQTITSGSTVSGTVNWEATYDANNDGTADDPGSVRFSVDNTVVLTENDPPFGDSPGFWNSTTVSNAQHTFKVEAVNTTGTVVASNSVNATVNNVVTPPPSPACSDTLDNDNDGFTDYPNDPGCSSAQDNDEVDTTPPPQGNVFLSPTGSDSNPCTQAAPCRSLQRGATVAQSGQTVSMASGNYPSQNLSNVQKAVTFVGPAKVADLGVTCTTGVTLKDISATSIAILAGNDNLTVDGGKFGFGTYTRNVENDPVVIGDVGSCSTGDLSNNVVVKNATIGGYIYPGGDEGSAHPDCLQFYGGNDGVKIQNNAFDQCDDSYIGGFPDFGDIRNILIENNTFTGLEESSSFYFSQWGQPGHPGRCEFITWRGNTIHANLGLRTECWDMLVENNTFDAPGPGDFQCSTWEQNWRAVWRNNTFLKGGACVT